MAKEFRYYIVRHNIGGICDKRESKITVDKGTMTINQWDRVIHNLAHHSAKANSQNASFPINGTVWYEIEWDGRAPKGYNRHLLKRYIWDKPEDTRRGKS